MTPRQFYTLFMLLAGAVFVATRHFLPRPPALAAQPAWKRAALALAAFVGGALGAKLPFVLGGSWLSAAGWFGDGKTITAGLLGGYLAVELTKPALGIHGKTGDTFALPLALALGVGRWGCFFNGCCYGTPTDLPWGVPFRIGDEWVKCHPTQVYESLFHLTMAGVLLLCVRHDLLRTHQLQMYLICYGVYRFLTEYLRPEPRDLLGLTFYQWIALVMIAAMAVQWWYEERGRRRWLASAG